MKCGGRRWAVGGARLQRFEANWLVVKKCKLNRLLVKEGTEVAIHGCIASSPKMERAAPKDVLLTDGKTTKN